MAQSRGQTSLVEVQLKQLHSSRHEEAWKAFLEKYSSRILQLIQFHGESEDNCRDCYVYICERLCRDRYRRLQSYHPGEGTGFLTWLSVVVRNLIVDWRRSQVGRNRPFRVISRLSETEQRIFNLVFEQGLPVSEAFEYLTSEFPSINAKDVEVSISRIRRLLSSGQIRALEERKFRKGATVISSLQETIPVEVLPDRNPSPESLAMINQRREGLKEAFYSLDPADQVLIRFRFEKELTLSEIAKLSGLKTPQRVDYQISRILEKLRATIK